MTDLVLLTTVDRVCTITMNRPDALAAGLFGDGIDQEQQYFRAWRNDPEEIGRRRNTVIGRGRTQTE